MSEDFDFLVFTGGLGLGQIHPGAPLEAAASKLAESLRVLAIRKVLLVPGESDIRPATLGGVHHYRKFVALLQAEMPRHKVQDLTATTELVAGLRLVGLNSATFGTRLDPGEAAQAAARLDEVRRVRREVQAGPAIVFMHQPDVEDPITGRGWTIGEAVAAEWRALIEDSNVVAVLAGHFHNARRTIYAQDYSWAHKKPLNAVATKTWIAPPLALDQQDRAAKPARGFSEVTVAETGVVRVRPRWLSVTAEEAPPELRHKVLEGDWEASGGRWQKAAEAYKEALQSSDAGIRSQAELGYARAGRELRRWYRPFLDWIPPVGWVARHPWIALVAFIGFCVVLALLRKLRAVITPPKKLSDDAPAEIFAVALFLKVREVSAVWAREKSRVPSSGFGDCRIALPDQALTDIVGSLPRVGGVEVGGLLRFALSIVQFVIPRIESGLRVNGTSRHMTAYASVRWLWLTDDASIESTPPHLTIGSQVKDLAGQVVWRILWTRAVR